jgi:4-hydroxy-2-oxoheptanedioate aldolase
MATNNPLKRRLAAQEKLLGAWVFSSNADIAELMARAGYGFVVICFEHGPGETMDVAHLLRAVESGGAEPLLRVPSHDPAILKRVLDQGARSIMVPMVETEDEARAIVAACRYPPLGRRGYAGTVVRASQFGFRRSYAREAHDDLFLALQIESFKGVENVEAIAAVEGVDVIFIGPNDLANSMGYLEQIEEPKVLEAIGRTLAGTRKAGKPAAIVPHAGRDASACVAMGFAMVAGAADIALLREGATADIARHAKAFDLA